MSLGSSDSIETLTSIGFNPDERSPRNGRKLKPMDEDGIVEESINTYGKKRRLRVDQVKALEENFEQENKLVPDRKAQLARELELQPRQVAVWFQNRRALWKKKQMETDYSLLKAKYESLEADYNAVQHHNQTLLKEIEELKFKQKDNMEGEEMNLLDFGDDKVSSNQLQLRHTLLVSPFVAKLSPDLKDGMSDSDSSAILSGENSNKSSVCCEHHISSPEKVASSSSSSCLNCTQLTSSRPTASHTVQPRLVKMEEHNLFNGEESCTYFSEEQPPDLQWYFSDQWTYD